MNFRTEIQLGEAPFKLSYSSNLLLLGSCFSDHIGAKLAEVKMNVLSNPFGVSFNPLSIASNISRAIEKIPYFESDLRENNSLYFSYDFHSSFSSSDKKQDLEQMNKALNDTHQFISNAEVIFITFGSAWAYRNIEENRIVSNCHKVPNKNFNKELLTLEAIVGRYVQILNELKRINPSLKVVFTVSPVRHLKDGFIENQRSKSILLEAIHRLMELDGVCSYFPSYEIVIDDLRDYRFFKKDMLHLNEVGIDYVWQKFANYYFDTATLAIQAEVKKVQLFLEHKAIHDVDMVEKQRDAAKQLFEKYPFLSR